MLSPSSVFNARSLKAAAACLGVSALIFSGLTHAQDVKPTLDKVKAAGVIVVSHRESSVPFSYLGADGKPVGFGWEICGRIVENVKKATQLSTLKVETQAVTSANRIPLLQNGTIDIECGSTTNNSQRNEQVSFAINYFYTGTRFLVKADSGIKGIVDLKGKKVVSTTGTTNYKAMDKMNSEQKLGFDLIGAKDHADAALMVEQGRAHAFAMDDILLYGLKANSKMADKLAVVGDAIQVEPYGIMVRKNDVAFKKLVDDTLKQLIASGEFAKLYDKWFTKAIPPSNMNLAAPMSAELKANLKALSDKPAM